MHRVEPTPCASSVPGSAARSAGALQDRHRPVAPNPSPKRARGMAPRSERVQASHVSDDGQAGADQVEREVRFAVVLYGGVSLAIYMNGIVQELYSLVRATATNPDGTMYLADTDLRGAERV